MSALLEVVNRSKSSEQASAYRRVCRGCSIRISTRIKRRPCRSRKERTLEWVNRVAVTVADEHYRKV